MSVLKDLMPDPPSRSDPSEELEFLYDLRDTADSENNSSQDNLDAVREMLYKRIQELEMKEGNI